MIVSLKSRWQRSAAFTPLQETYFYGIWICSTPMDYRTVKRRKRRAPAVKTTHVTH